MGEELPVNSVLHVEGQTGHEPREQHEDQLSDVDVRLHPELKTHDHVDRVQHDTVSDSDHRDDDLQVLPERQVDGVQQKKDAQNQQCRPGDEGHEPVTLEGSLH
jgi:hypothetical protein